MSEENTVNLQQEVPVTATEQEADNAQQEANLQAAISQALAAIAANQALDPDEKAIAIAAVNSFSSISPENIATAIASVNAITTNVEQTGTSRDSKERLIEMLTETEESAVEARLEALKTLLNDDNLERLSEMERLLLKAEEEGLAALTSEEQVFLLRTRYSYLTEEQALSLVESGRADNMLNEMVENPHEALCDTAIRMESRENMLDEISMLRGLPNPSGRASAAFRSA